MQPPEATTTTGYQSALAAYCRSGRYTAIPGVHKGHVTHYRRLVYNVVDDMLQSAYPLTYHLLTAKEWKQMVQDFFSSHACQSPQVWYMPRELHEYLVKTQHPLLEKYPFLSELLWLEWLEVELFMMEDKPAAFTAFGDIQADAFVLNPEHHLQHFHYPVHLKQAKQISAEDKGDYFLVLFRKPDNGEVAFMQLSPVLVTLLELLEERPQAMHPLVEQACATWQLPLNDAIREAAGAFFAQALENRLILGYDTKSHIL
ncbi:DUF2063 domain-containing protein [uncultured Chitinophaga sp.]|jgi:Uncharacterized protein conserved in bacteria (DUF2063).|uniref:HvfC/BufC N-terminal domain-containing protein n=1 Tax=uncultured Chitinophaga sp. TaxID=339340 RepID=UPI002631A795|nr:DNA-binding domain-containing protein [uncultured Chitinophaga sp.]